MFKTVSEVLSNASYKTFWAAPASPGRGGLLAVMEIPQYNFIKLISLDYSSEFSWQCQYSGKNCANSIY